MEWYGRKSFKIGLAVLIQYRRVTDRHQPASHVTVASTRYAYLRRAVKTNYTKHCINILEKQEAQLMPTNLRDAFIGLSRSPNTVPFHILGIVSYRAAVTLSLRRTVFYDFRLQKMS